MNTEPTLPIPEIGLLRSFATVARCLNISAASAELGLSQPALSQQMQRLEAQLGQALLRRNSRPMTLTPAGEMLARELPPLIGQIEALLGQVRAVDQAPRQVLRVVMPDSLSCVLGAEFISASGNLARTVELRSGISPWIEDTFRAGQFDLAVDCPPFDPATRADQLPLFNDPYMIVSPKRLQGIAPGDFARHEPQVAYGRNSKFGLATAGIARDLGAGADPRFTFDSTQSLLRFVQAGYGWAVTSAFCLFQSPAAMRGFDLHPCRPQDFRRFFLLHRGAGAEGLAQEAAVRMTRVFQGLVGGPWAAISPQAAAQIRAVNSQPD